MSAKFLFRLSFSIFSTMTLIMAFPIYVLFLDPIRAVRDSPELYVLFLFIPYVVSLALYIAGRRKINKDKAD
jgi:hypothetical protein